MHTPYITSFLLLWAIFMSSNIGKREQKANERGKERENTRRNEKEWAATTTRTFYRLLHIPVILRNRRLSSLMQHYTLYS